jgi:DNA-binding NarL/FixJ family response regulator
VDTRKKTEKRADRICRVVLVEDHVILRDGLRSLLSMESDLEVVGVATSSDDAIVVVQETNPNLVICDIGLPGKSGLALIPELKQIDSCIRALVLTAHCTDEYVRAALEAGADGYVLKDASRAELIQGIRTVLSGQQFLSSQVTSRVVSGFLGQGRESNQPRKSAITPREEEIMILIASALSTKEIARKLDLSVKTVEKHRSNLMRKLGLRSTAAVTLYAVRHNYLSVDDDPPEI